MTITEENAKTKNEIGALLYNHGRGEFHRFMELVVKMLDRYADSQASKTLEEDVYKQAYKTTGKHPVYKSGLRIEQKLENTFHLLGSKDQIYLITEKSYIDDWLKDGWIKSKKPDKQNNETMDDCCMSCSWWRYTNNGKGECMSFNKNIYTNEGFYCKNHIEGEYSS